MYRRPAGRPSAPRPDLPTSPAATNLQRLAVPPDSAAIVAIYAGHQPVPGAGPEWPTLACPPYLPSAHLNPHAHRSHTTTSAGPRPPLRRPGAPRSSPPQDSLRIAEHPNRRWNIPVSATSRATGPVSSPRPAWTLSRTGPDSASIRPLVVGGTERVPDSGTGAAETPDSLMVSCPPAGLPFSPADGDDALPRAAVPCRRNPPREGLLGARGYQIRGALPRGSLNTGSHHADRELSSHRGPWPSWSRPHLAALLPRLGQDRRRKKNMTSTLTIPGLGLSGPPCLQVSPLLCRCRTWALGTRHFIERPLTHQAP